MNAADPSTLPDDPEQLREVAARMVHQLQRLDQEAAIAAEPTVTVRWVKDAQQHVGQINGRTYTGRGPVYRRRMTPSGEVRELVRPGEEQQIPASAARVLHEAGYVAIEGDEPLIR
jgi:hypothetical protein